MNKSLYSILFFIGFVSVFPNIPHMSPTKSEITSANNWAKFGTITSGVGVSALSYMGCSSLCKKYKISETWSRIMSGAATVLTFALWYKYAGGVISNYMLQNADVLQKFILSEDRKLNENKYDLNRIQYEILDSSTRGYEESSHWFYKKDANTIKYPVLSAKKTLEMNLYQAKQLNHAISRATYEYSLPENVHSIEGGPEGVQKLHEYKNKLTNFIWSLQEMIRKIIALPEYKIENLGKECREQVEILKYNEHMLKKRIKKLENRGEYLFIV